MHARLILTGERRVMLTRNRIKNPGISFRLRGNRD